MFEEKSGALLLETTIVGEKGCSGAPVLDDSGQVLGIANSGVYTDNTAYGPVLMTPFIDTLNDMRSAVVPYAMWSIGGESEQAVWERIRQCEGLEHSGTTAAMREYYSMLADYPHAYSALVAAASSPACRTDPSFVAAASRMFVDANPGDDRGLATLGLALERAGDYKGAAAALSQALELNETAAKHYWLARVMHRSNDWKVALEHYARSASMEPKHLPSYRAVASVSGFLKDESSWLQTARQWTARYPEDTEAWSFLARACAGPGLAQDRQAALVRVRALNPYVGNRLTWGDRL